MKTVRLRLVLRCGCEPQVEHTFGIGTYWETYDCTDHGEQRIRALLEV